MGNTVVFQIIVIILFILAISDLVVGVSNDAVNFLNSAIGSKAAKFWIIMGIAAAGVIIGATFSSGMMEVARKGIFNPQHFNFENIMIIFLAVMITDVILLDLFNTFGLPTSTTVSIVFELLGASVAMAWILSRNATGELADIATYINSEKAMKIIFGILSSVIISFTFGAIVQYISRIIFSFNYNKTLKYFGSLWGGIAITAITYFILIKGAKGSSFINDEMLETIKSNTIQILFYSFIGWTLFLQIITLLFRLNILRIIVLIGTFALAMAFAGNDLVNFIGVPLAGFESFKTYIATEGASPDSLMMNSLAGKIQTPTLYLVIAGLIMVITLWLSKKARTVVKTELNLSNQEEVNERFESSLLARTIVRQFIQFNKAIQKIAPLQVKKFINKRFDFKSHKKKLKKKGDNESYDLIRATVNLTVASIIISFATSYKLPLSTTYVTFMVAMGTSLADRAWDRESAVYRITGVITVIGGWFFTAFCAFTVAFLFAILINWGGLYVISVLILLAVFFVYKTHILHKNRLKEEEKEDLSGIEIELDEESIYEACNKRILNSLLAVTALYNTIIENFINEKRKKLKKAVKSVMELNKESKNLKKNMHKVIRKLQEESIESGHHYVEIVDYLRETAHCLEYIAEPVFTHVDNNHSPLLAFQAEELNDYKDNFEIYINKVIKAISKSDFTTAKDLNDEAMKLTDKIQKIRKKLIKHIKKEPGSTKTNMLFLDILNESKNLVLFINNILKSNRDFEKQRKSEIRYL